MPTACKHMKKEISRQMRMISEYLKVLETFSRQRCIEIRLKFCGTGSESNSAKYPIYSKTIQD